MWKDVYYLDLDVSSDISGVRELTQKKKYQHMYGVIMLTPEKGVSWDPNQGLVDAKWEC